MLETIAIKTVFGKAKDFAKSVPREVWYALGALAAWWLLSSHYISEGREQVLTELRAAEKQAKEDAEKAVEVADKKAAARAKDEAEIIGKQLDAIERAEATGGNALDEIF